MPMLRVTADVLERSFDGITLARGEDYAERDRVTDIERLDDGSRFRARVQGSRSEPYAVEITLHFAPLGTTASGSCSCPVGVNCKHAAALAALVLEQDPTGSPHQPALVEPDADRSIGLADADDVQPQALPLELTRWLEQAREAARPDADEYPAQIHNRLIYLLGVVLVSIRFGFVASLLAAFFKRSWVSTDDSTTCTSSTELLFCSVQSSASSSRNNSLSEGSSDMRMVRSVFDSSTMNRSRQKQRALSSTKM